MNNCVVRTMLSAVMGGGMGVMFGIFMGTMDTVGDSCRAKLFFYCGFLTGQVPNAAGIWYRRRSGVPEPDAAAGVSGDGKKHAEQEQVRRSCLAPVYQEMREMAALATEC